MSIKQLVTVLSSLSFFIYNVALIKPIRAMRPQLLFRKIHKWAGLILGIQILLWFASGFLMSFMPIEEIHGDHLLKPQQATTINLSQVNLSALAEQIKTPIESIEVKTWLGQTVVAVKSQQQTKLYSTPDMQPISSFKKPQVERIIKSQFKDELKVISINRLNEVPSEARGRSAPLWQVQLSGPENPRVYISEQTGEIVAKRTDRWRLFDFLWMLHIMDYDEREDFNHPLLYLTALSALLFTLTGFVLLYFTLRRKRKANITKS